MLAYWAQPYLIRDRSQIQLRVYNVNSDTDWPDFFIVAKN